jgi:hypothetical protein
VSIGVLADAVPRDAVDEAVAVCGVRVSRVRISGGAVVLVLKENLRHGKTAVDSG